MKFNKCVVAVCVSAAILSGAAQAAVQNDAKSSYSQNVERAAYTFYLEHPTTVATGSSKQIQQQIKQSQDSFIQSLNQIDSSAKVIFNSSLLANLVTVEIDPQYLPSMRALANVTNVFKEERLSPVAAEHNFAVNNAQLNTATVAADAEEEITMLTPYTGSETAGTGVSVAIISTGIDYTLAEFGGSGVYGDASDAEVPPEAGSYLEAMSYGAIEYAGFPTEVVAGGWDLASENFGIDANPIDQNLSYESWNGWVYPTGMGTELASIVHQLAPAAKLHAYKVYNVSGATWDPSYISGRGPTAATVIQALEHILDPNQDGDMSDHLDIALMDAGGAAAFYDIDGNASVGLMQLMITRAAAQGLTVVSHSGNLAEYSLNGMAETKHRSWLAYDSSPTAVITVGAVERGDDDTLVVPSWAPMGPVRGSQALKPELVTYTDNQPVVLISNEDADAARVGSRSGALAGAARIAAAAAVVKSHHSSFGPVEIKAILANTAVNNGILRTDGMTAAEILSVGHGVESVEDAVASPLVMWEADSSQPYIQFGMHEVADSKTIHKNLVIKNVSDSAQTYSVSYQPTGEKPAHDALMVTLPESVSIPANSSIVVPVTLFIDGTKLPQWPLMMTADHTDANLTLTELNGFITLASEGKPELNLGWMVKARNNTTVTKRPNATEFPEYLGWNPDTYETEYNHLEWALNHYPDLNGYSDYQSFVASFVNHSNTPTTLQAFPLLIDNPTETEEQAELKGHKIRAVGGAFFDDAMCSVTGKKLSIAVNFFQPAQMSLANYIDKVGDRLFFYDLFHEQAVLDNGWNESFTGANIWDEAEMINQPFVSLNDAGQPTTYFIDYNQAYDWQNPAARLTESSLPTYFTNNGRNVVSQICVEDLFHHELDSVEDFDQNLGFHIETDRDSGNDYAAPIAQFNPVRGGTYSVDSSCYFDEWAGQEVCSDTVFDRSVKVGFAVKGEEDDLTTMDFAQTLTVEPGQEVYIASAGRSEMAGVGGPEAPKGFLVMSTNDDYFEIGYNSYADGDGAIVAKVKENQSFAIDETAEVNSIVGTIELDTAGFFAYGPTDFEAFELHIVNSLPGSPFAINQQTHELYVANPEALDFENTTSYDVKVVTQKGQSVGETTVINVSVNNINDMAPMLDQAVAAQLSVPTMVFKKGEAGTFGIDISGLFIEPEGDVLSYSVEGSGFKSLSIDGMSVTGELEEEGSYQLTVIASDGIHEESHSMTVESEFEAKSSGGSLGWLSLLLGGLVAIRRRP
ncbi:S8 family serine peptidase [Shewanella sp. UCD-KL21]|uniref:S8 family serine peptidase n=1 Tax=Shewanella sp. UCD-KL21 TaxID=1917164 RepID=UPI000970BB7B|nr:S8 family serine peptidase [Shewanella sp. UCD-KL21]